MTEKMDLGFGRPEKVTKLTWQKKWEWFQWWLKRNPTLEVFFEHPRKDQGADFVTLSSRVALEQRRISKTMLCSIIATDIAMYADIKIANGDILMCLNKMIYERYKKIVPSDYRIVNIPRLQFKAADRVRKDNTTYDLTLVMDYITDDKVAFIDADDDILTLAERKVLKQLAKKLANNNK